MRGPRLGTKLMLLGLALLVLPWFSYRQLVEMEQFLVHGQSQAQLLNAEGISTLFNGREDLFEDLPVSLEDYEALYAHPLHQPIRLDGVASEWQDVVTKMVAFDDGSADADARSDGAFRVVLGERTGQLYVYIEVRDDRLLPRESNYLRLDNADHIRLSYTQHDGQDGRINITLPGNGVTTAYHMDQDWRFARDGQPENRLQGAMATVEGGYSVEFRLPLELLGTRQHFGLTVVDVDDPVTRSTAHITQTLPKAGKQGFNLVVLRSPQVLNIIQGLGYSGARILVVDAQKRVRAETGSYVGDPDAVDATGESGSASAPEIGWLQAAARDLLDDVALPHPDGASAVAGDEAITRSLSGTPTALRQRFPDGAEIIVAAHPIISRDRVIGTVVVEQNINEILTLQREALEQIVFVSVAALLAVFVLLLAFSVRLAWRIRNLRTEASSAIDQHGRLRASSLVSETHAGDEIGDLARSISGMLTKLHQHNHFLENMPRTLRHEINNPLNTLSTSLQNLEAESPAIASSKYLESAKRGVMRIGSIVQNLADAASLEESLEAEDFEELDLNDLLESYVANCRITHGSDAFIYRGPGRPVRAMVADYRIEQLLDKIIDNAIDFRRTDSPIRVQLDIDREFLQISVANRGPVLAPGAERTMFDSMVSHRKGAHDRLHFGLGLYVVRVIAEHHGGAVHAGNLPDGSGVAITVRLPRVDADRPPQRSPGTWPVAPRPA